MVKSWITKKLAMFLLRNADKIDQSTACVDNVSVSFNKGDLEKDYWQQSFIEFSMDCVDYSIRYFPNRFIRDFTPNGKPHKTYFEGWYTFSNGEYGIYKAEETDIKTCKKLLKRVKVQS